MILYCNSNSGFLINNRFVYQQAGAELARATEKATEAIKGEESLPDKVLIEMAKLKARKNLYEDWGSTTMKTFEKQKSNLQKYLKLKNPDKITDPAVAYKHLNNLQKKMKGEWDKEQLRRVKASGKTGTVDVGNYTYEFYLNPAPCTPINNKEQAYLKTNGKKMPENQIDKYKKLVMDLQMKLALEGETAFRDAANQAGIDMSLADATQVYDESDMVANNIVKKYKK